MQQSLSDSKTFLVPDGHPAPICVPSPFNKRWKNAMDYEKMMKKRKNWNKNERFLKMYIYKLMTIFLVLPLFSCAKVDDNSSKQSINNMSYSEKNDQIIYNINDLFNENKSKDALSIITKHSDSFNIDQKVGVGAILYSNGYVDLSKDYFEEAALTGNGEALYRLGFYYNYSENEKNIDLSIKYFEGSVDSGYLESYINLGEIYLYEEGYINLEKAKYFFNRAVDVGLIKGNYGLGEINLKEGNFKKAKQNFDVLKENGYYLECYDGYVNLYSKYRDSDFYNIDMAKKYIDLIELVIEDPRKNEIISDFYSGNHKYKDLIKSKYYNRSLS